MPSGTVLMGVSTYLHQTDVAHLGDHGALVHRVVHGHVQGHSRVALVRGEDGSQLGGVVRPTQRLKHCSGHAW